MSRKLAILFVTLAIASLTESLPAKQGDNCSNAGLICQNGGICNSSFGSITCSCLPGFIGIRCESKITRCAKACLNGGTCQVQRNGGFSCQCLPGYVGDSCQNLDFLLVK